MTCLSICPHCKAFRERVEELEEIIRQHARVQQQRVNIGPLMVDPGAKLVTVNERPIPFSPLEFAFLEVLAQNSPAVVSRDAAMGFLYNNRDEPDPKILDVVNCKVRRKLQAAGCPPMIISVWGIGWRLVESAAEASPHHMRPGFKLTASRVLEHLARGPMGVTQMSYDLGRSATCITDHLGTLIAKGLVVQAAPRSNGHGAIYRLAHEQERAA